MSKTIYTINKGVNRAMEVKGIKAQYIVLLAGGLVALLILFALLYIAGLNAFLCLGIVLPAGGALFLTALRLSNKYGEHGLMKSMARRRLPKSIKVRNRRLFLQNLKT